MKYIGLQLCIIAFGMISCVGNTGKDLPDNLLVKVNNHQLYRQDLRGVMPHNLSGEDSAKFANAYIRNWIEDALLSDVAERNIPNTANIDQAVADYRRTLIVHTYQQQLLKQRLSNELPEQELIDFYDNNRKLFLLEQPLIKGLFLKVPLKAPQLSDVRRWYKDSTHVEQIEKYSLRYSLNYEYFYNRWVPLEELLGKIPLKNANPIAYVKEHRQIELTDTLAHYFLNVTDFLGEGDILPYDYARPSVLEMLINRKKAEFLKEIKDELYEDALEDKMIIYNFKQNE